MYYTIDENAARTAHNMNSFFPFKEGRVTAEYRDAVDSAKELAEHQKRRVDPMYHEKIDALLDAYARRLADWYNKGFAIEARCPSVMVAGPAKFPTRRKEKQNDARAAHIAAHNDIAALHERIQTTGTGGISSDDPDALDKLKAKLAGLERNHADMKDRNAYYRKYKTLDGCPGVSAEEATRIKAHMATFQWLHKPYELSNNLAEIKRLRGRVAEIEALAKNPLQGWTFDGGEVVANTEWNRLQILFDHKPDEAMRQQLKRNAFRWAPSAGAWQRQLTSNAVRAAKEITCMEVAA